MAVAFDAAGPSSAGTSFSTGPGTWTQVNNGNGILVGVTTFTGTTNDVTGVTYGGVTVPFLGFVPANNSNAGGVALYGLVGPSCPTGSNTVSVTVSGNQNHNAGSVSVSGAGSLGSVVTNFASGSGVSAAFGSTTSGGLIVSAACQGSGGTFTATSPNVKRIEKLTTANSGSDNIAMGTDPSTGSAVSPAYTIAASDLWGIVAVEVLPQAAQNDGAPPAGWRAPWPPALAGVFGPNTPFDAGGVYIDPAPNLAVNAGVAAASAVAMPVTFKLHIAGLGGTGAGYFADQNGSPRMVLGDAVWGLPGNAGRWSSGDWQGDFNTYFATRASQGFTVAYTKPMGTTQNLGINDDGRTFDGLFPFQGGSLANPSTGLTSAYWARIDYMLGSALAQGITVFLNAIGYDSDFETSGPLAGKSASEFQSYGAALGARYASQANLIWVVADDYFGSSDTKISSFLTGLRGAGANQPISIENFPESTSRADVTSGSATAWGAANGQYNFCYSYNVTYFGIEKAFLESSPITPIQGDGYFYQGGSSYAGGSGGAAYDRAIRQDAWHAISSGARGIIHGDEACWQWQSTAQAAATNNWYQKNNAGNIRTLMESLPNWHLLIPDTSSLLVTAGRGTHATGFTSGGGGGQYEVAFTDSYVTASRTAAGDLAVIYLSHGTTITIDQTKMVSGYVAFWVDPITGAKTSTATGSTYNSTAQGNNSQGDPDWVLVLQAPNAVSATAGVATASAVAVAPSTALTSTPGVATSTAVASGPPVAVTAAGGIATCLAVALSALTAHTATPGVATGSATAPGTSSAHTATSGVATSTAAGAPAVQAAGAAAGVAASLASALTASDTGNPTAGVATGSAVAPNPSVAVTVSAGVAAASATAVNPTVSTSGSTNAPAGAGAATAAAVSPQTVITLSSGAASSTGSALTAQGASAAQPGAGAGVAVALQPVIALQVHAGVAAASATATPAQGACAGQPGAGGGAAVALQPAIALQVHAGAAAGGATASQATANTSSQTNANAGVAAASATAMPAAITSAAQPGAAGSLAIAPAPVAATGSRPAAAAVTAAATLAVIPRTAAAGSSSAQAAPASVALMVTAGVATASAVASGGQVPRQVVPGTVTVPVVTVAKAIAGIAGKAEAAAGLTEGASVVGRSSDV